MNWLILTLCEHSTKPSFSFSLNKEYKEVKKKGYLERGAHAGATGVANTVYVRGGEGGGGKSRPDEWKCVLEVVLGGLTREEAMARRSDVGVAWV